MTTIWKFELAITDVQRVQMPAHARMLHVAGQDVRGPYGGMNPVKLMLWAQVDPNEPIIERQIAVVGTGNPAPDVTDEDSSYVGTAICGEFVWHIFDGGEVRNP